MLQSCPGDLVPWGPGRRGHSLPESPQHCRLPVSASHHLADDIGDCEDCSQTTSQVRAVHASSPQSTVGGTSPAPAGPSPRPRPWPRPSQLTGCGFRAWGQAPSDPHPVSQLTEPMWFLWRPTGRLLYPFQFFVVHSSPGPLTVNWGDIYPRAWTLCPRPGSPIQQTADDR